MPRVTPFVTGLAVSLVTSAMSAGAADTQAKGTLVYKMQSIPIKYAYFVMGADEFSKKTIRRVILSSTDIGAKVTACKSMSCTEREVREGMSVDLVPGGRIEYWIALNGQLVQYSGTEPVESLQITANEATRLAGKLKFDSTGAGGPRLDIEFDAPLTKDLRPQ
ncbi:MAG: hypothetical protein ABI569_11315 [Casimicrobiaceae bacterium]